MIVDISGEDGFGATEESKPSVNYSFLKKILRMGGGVEEDVRTDAEARFDERNNSKIDRLESEREIWETELKRVNQSHDRKIKERGSVNRFHDLPVALDDTGKPAVAVPWSKFDFALFWVLLVVSIVLMAISLNTMATYMISSGLVIAFVESPWMAYLTSLLPVSLPIVFKLAYSQIRNPRIQQAYFFFLAGMGALSGIAWVIAFSWIFPSVSKSGSDIVAELVGAATSGGSVSNSGYSDFVLSALQIITELLVAAVIFIRVEAMAITHTPARSTENEKYKQLSREIAEDEEGRGNCLKKIREVERTLLRLGEDREAHVVDSVREWRRMSQAYRVLQNPDDEYGSAMSVRKQA